ncbi:MAG: LysM peptidoglycan-binding domain-containing protein [Bacteroidaceae bacterium]|nr:LysM peptidoglycan-binding domain-containing protein [Bacteroidaceae bacterium]
MKRILTLLYCLWPMLLFGQGILSTLEDMHSVVKGETWESIAASHGISVLDLQAANPDVVTKKLKKGTLLILPRKALPSQDVTVTEEPAKPVPVIRTAIPDLKVGVLLPLSDKNMLEFYRGLLMAADSVRKAGVNLDIHAWDCGSSASQVEPLLSQFSELDILFGPKEASQITAVAEACKEQGTRLVLPFWSGQPLDYPLVYNATAPSTILFEAAVEKLMKFYSDKNYVIVKSGKEDSKGKILSETLVASLTQRSITPRTLALEGDDFAYESAFNQFRENMILLDDSSIPSLDVLLAHLKTFRQKHPQYRLSLLGYADWQDETERLLEDLFAFDSYIISPYYYNVLDDRIKRFERSYARNFRAYIVKTNNPRYAALGFDLGCYFLAGISSLGDTFDQMQGSLRQEPYQNWFHFQRGSTQTNLSFSNNFVQFIHLTPEKKVELIR